MAYSDKVIDHYNNPRNLGSLPKDDQSVGTGIVGAPECGDVMKLQIKVQNDVIVDAKFKTFGCGSAIASSSLATEWLKGRTVEDAYKIKNTDIVQYAQVYEVEDIRVIVDMKSAIYLQGTQLDYHKDLLSGQFKFSNPNATKSCGCGESFSA